VFVFSLFSSNLNFTKNWTFSMGRSLWKRTAVLCLRFSRVVGVGSYILRYKSERSGCNVPMQTASEVLQRLLPLQFCHHRWFWLAVLVTLKKRGWQKCLVKGQVQHIHTRMKTSTSCVLCTSVWSRGSLRYCVWPWCTGTIFAKEFEFFRWGIRLFQSLFIFLFVRLWNKCN